MTLNIATTRVYLQSFDFKTLFIEELGWSNPKNKGAFSFQTKEGQFYRKAIAELSGATVYEISSSEGTIPDSKVREIISKEIQKINFEHILIFIDEKRTQTIWRWLKKQEKRTVPREHYFATGQTGDAFIAKLHGLLVDIAELEKDITITDVARKIQKALDLEKVTKKFFKEYQQQFVIFLDLIDGIDNDADKRWYASVIIDRLMFIYFLQEKGFLNEGDRDYLYEKLKETKKTFGSNKYYSVFLNKLFFEGFAKPEHERSKETRKLLGKVKYLNGGLFLHHKIEEKYPNISIPDVAFENILKSDDPKGLFEQFSWSLDDSPGGKDDEINPDVLGYIFEKYINQKAFGAYYTRTEITEYLCEQTIYKLILDAINEAEVDPKRLKVANADILAKPKRYDTVEELLIKLDAETCKKLIVGPNAILPNLSLLDPACGSGAFLVAAMKTLINVYSAILGKINFLGDRQLSEWKRDIEKDHPSINYYVKKTIITNNLYGVDIMEEATEIAKLRLFLALVSSAQSVDQLEPLPNIDFNIMNGNSLIGMMRVDPNKFNKHIPPSIKKPKGKIVKKDTLFEPAVMLGNLFSEGHAIGYQQLINEKEAAIRKYKNVQGIGSDGLQELRDRIHEQERQAIDILDRLLLEEFNNLQIRYETVSWDKEKNKEGKSVKRPMAIEDIKDLEPFHWGYEFSDIFGKKNGFDAIITNPPWEIFKPNSKEFFSEYSNVVTKKRMTIHNFEKEQERLLQDEEIRGAWLEYLSRFPHISSYFRHAAQFKNQISIINGKKAGSDINLYKLFTEQCYNLLRDKGYCGIIIPTGIYTDLGAKQLRKLLFEDCKVQQLVSFANEKFLFEAVDHRFKFCFLSFEKGEKTESFLATFRINPRECVSADELDNFLHMTDNFVRIPIEFIIRQSPDSLSVMEIRKAIDFSIVERMLKQPKLGDDIEGSWKFKLGNEFHMTGDSAIFEVEASQNALPLFEGKMINQFVSFSDRARYFIPEQVGRNSLLGRAESDVVLMDYQTYRIALRAVSSSTNSRTLIATILPKNVFAGHSLFVSIGNNGNSQSDLVYILSFINSFVLDYYIRQVVSQNISLFYLYQLPVPRLAHSDNLYLRLIEKAARLICMDERYSSLWNQLTKKTWNIGVSPVRDEDRDLIRAELDAMVAHAYGLSEEAFSYILTTFPLASDVQKNSALAAFKSLSLEIDEGSSKKLEILDLLKKGESPSIEFKSTLRVDIRAGNVVDKKIEMSVLKTLAAFLNSSGGTLLIGVDDKRNILGLTLDFASFSKGDKIDEFQKHFDNLIAKSLGNRFQRYLKVEFPEIENKQICSITIKEKSDEPVYIVNEAGQETFYIRRQASTIDLKPSETVKYIKEHWK